MNHRKAFTLVELVVSMTIASVLLLGMGSAMMIGSRAMPTVEGASYNISAAAEAAEQITAELQYAVTIIDSNSTAVEFTVADRDGNDVPETIRYQWSGTVGDPLTRQYNQGTVAEVLTDIQQFSLAYDLQSTTTEVPQGNESDEALLAGYDSYSYWASPAVKQDRWLAQYFCPSLPADTVSWKVTRVSFYAAPENLTTGQCKVQLQLASAGGLPTGVVLEEKTLRESTLALLGWTQVECNFSTVSGLSPDQRLCLVLEWVYGAEACQVLIQDEDVPAASAGYRVSTDQGTSWTQYSDQSFLFEVHGAVTTAGEPEIETTYYLNQVTMSLRRGSDAQASVTAGTRLLNRPEVVQ